MKYVVFVLLLSSILVEPQTTTTEDIPYTTETETFEPQIYPIAASHNFHPESVNPTLPIPELGTVAWWAQSGSEGYEGVGIAFTNAFVNQTTQQVIYESALSDLVYKCWTYDSFIIPMFQVMGTDNILVNAHIAYIMNIQNRIQWKRIGIKTSQTAGSYTSFTASYKIFNENEGEIFTVPTINHTFVPTINPTTFSPTTFSPTTFSPTTFSPTINPTINPTTNPTSSTPTTSVPSTYTPTFTPTSRPTTSIPTTLSPTKSSDEAAADNNDQETTLSVTDMDRYKSQYKKDFMAAYGWIIIVVFFGILLVCVVVVIWYYWKRETRKKIELQMCGDANADVCEIKCTNVVNVHKNELQLNDNDLVEYVDTIKQQLDSNDIVEYVNTMEYPLNIGQDFEVVEDCLITPKGDATTKKTNGLETDDNTIGNDNNCRGY